MHDVIVVGAGPAGCRIAGIVAKHGYDVLVLEEHPRMGTPVQCTGLVSKKIGKTPRNTILNKINKAKFCCGDEYFEIKSKESMLLLDREKYDVWIARNAKRFGAEFKLSTRFLDFKNGTVLTNHEKINTKILVGADGPNSPVAKSVGIKLPDNLVFAVQATIESSFRPDTIELHFSSDIAPGSFAWVVPENKKTARVGLMTTKKSNKYLDNFLKERFPDSKILNKTGDVIRYGLIEESVADNVLLVGDAACQVKPFSGGGLVYNKIGAEIAGDAIVKSLETNDFSKEFLMKNYDKKWKEELTLPIIQGMLIKSIFSGISNMPIIFSIIRLFGIPKLADFLDVDFLQK